MKKYYLFVFLFIYASSSFSQLLPPTGPGNSFHLNGSSHINIGTSIINNIRTIECWFKLDQAITDTLRDGQSLVGRDFDNGNILRTNEFVLYFRPQSFGVGTGRLAFYVQGGPTTHVITSDTDFWPANIWHHVAGVIDPVKGMRLYINGVLQQDTIAYTSPIASQSGSVFDDVCIGRWGNASSGLGGSGFRNFKGEIDEMRFWTTARSPLEIRENMCQKVSPNSSGLKGYYKFDEVSGTVLNGAGSTPFNGSVVGTSTWRTSGAPIGEVSRFVYNDAVNWPGWSSFVLKHQRPNGDSLFVFNVSGNPDGIHIYEIDTLPTITSGLANWYPDNYFGIFVAHDNDTSFDYDFTYQYQFGNGFINSFNEATLETKKRKSNSGATWYPKTGMLNTTSKTMGVAGESYRAEYILEVELGEIDLGKDTTICGEAPFTLIAGVADSMTSYLWQDGSSLPTFQVSTTGLYWVVAINPCGILRDSIYVTVESYPEPGFSYTISGNSIMIQDTSQHAQSWMWDFGDGNFSSQQNPAYTYSIAGSYTLCLTVTNDCGSRTRCDTISVGLDKIEKPLPGLDWKLQVNPFTQTLVLTLNPPASHPYPKWELRLFDIHGRLLIENTELERINHIPLGNLSNGYYFIQLLHEGDVFIVEKIIKN